MMQLLAVACLYLAAKMEETQVPLAVDLQTESRFVFEAKTIQRIELLVLSTLKWRMQSVTPFSTYVRSPFAEDYSLSIGYPTFKGQVLNGKELWNLVEGLEANNLLYYTHLLTGYIGSESFLNTVLEVVNKLRSVNPGLLYVCDPVLGDEGKLYVPQELVSVYREKVVPVSSMLTPNQFEAELLTGSSCSMARLHITMKILMKFEGSGWITSCLLYR